MTFVLGTSVVLAACVPPADQSAETGTDQSARKTGVETGMTRAERAQAADRDYELKAQGLANEDKRLTQQQKANEAKDLLSAQTAEENAKVNLDRQAKDLEGRKYDADADVRSADLRASAQRYQADKQYSTMNKVIESAGPVMTAMGAINSAAAQSKRADAAEKREDRRAAAEERSAKNDESRSKNEARALDLQIALQMTEQQRTAEIESFKADVERYKSEVDTKVKTLESQRNFVTANPGDNEEQSKAELGRINAALESANRTSGDLARQSAIISSQPATAIGYANAARSHREAGNVFEEYTESSPAVNLLTNSNLGQGASAPTPTGFNGGDVTPPGNTTETSELLCFGTVAGTGLGSGCDKEIYENMVDLISKPSAILASGASLQANDLSEAKNRATDAVNQFYTTQRNSFESFLEQQRAAAEKAGDSKAGAKATNTMNRYDAAVNKAASEIQAAINRAADVAAIERLLRDKETPVLDPDEFAETAGRSASDATTGMRFQPGDKYLNPQVMMASADPGENSAQSFGLNNQSPAFDLGGQGTCELLGATKKC